LDDLIFYECGEWFSFDFKDEIVKPPPMSNHMMFCYSGNLILFNSFEEYYHLNLHSSTQVWNLLSFKKSKSFEMVQKVTPVVMRDVVRILGGYIESDQSVNDSMILICFESISHILVKTQNPIFNLPPPRYNYSCAPLKSDILYFGGQNGEKIFNDLYLYDSVFCSFKQIDCGGLIPPPLHSSTLINFGSTDFYLHGGQSYNGVESSMYKIDLLSKKWNSIVSSEKLNQTPIAGHKSIILNPYQKNFFIFGGYNDLYETLTEESIKVSNFFSMDERNSFDSIISYFSLQFEKQNMTDVSFIIEKQEIKCHKSFLSARCNYLKELMKKDDIVEILEFKFETFKTYIQFLYSGELKIVGDQIKDLLELGKRSQKHYSFFNQIFKLNLHLNSNLEFYKQLQSDLLFMKTSELNSDVKVNLIEDDVVFKSFNAHKFILFRSNHFIDAFRSGMKESIENEIDFIGISENSMETILHYLYTNECTPSTQDAVEVLVHCNLFRLDDLAQQCRELIKIHLNEDNILDLSAFAALYYDDYLIDATARFLSANFEKFSEDSVTDLPTNFKTKFFELYSRKVKKINHKKKFESRKLHRVRKEPKVEVKEVKQYQVPKINHRLIQKKPKPQEKEEEEIVPEAEHIVQRKLKTYAALLRKFNNENVHFE
jgi:rubrerythrin